MIKKSGKYLQFVIRIYNEDLGLLKALCSRLKKIGLKSYIHIFGKKGQSRNFHGKIVTYRNDYYALEISNRRDVKRFLIRSSIKHPGKVEKVKQVLSLLKEVPIET